MRHQSWLYKYNAARDAARVIYFDNLICSRVSGPIALKDRVGVSIVFNCSEKNILEHFLNRVKKYGLVARKRLPTKTFSEIKKFPETFLLFIC